MFIVPHDPSLSVGLGRWDLVRRVELELLQGALYGHKLQRLSKDCVARVSLLLFEWLCSLCILLQMELGEKQTSHISVEKQTLSGDSEVMNICFSSRDPDIRCSQTPVTPTPASHPPVDSESICTHVHIHKTHTYTYIKIKQRIRRLMQLSRYQLPGLPINGEIEGSEHTPA